MALAAGTRLGPCEILAAIGAGGMGEVYRARDRKLGRDVALKILPDSFVDDPDRVSRFRREAQVLASLNHPHIAAIYGLEEASPSTSSGQAAVQFLVLELVEGDTLAERLQRGALPVEDTLRFALQIAEALESAHERGIIHRDLKPANIKVTPDGRVKVLDYGLAKAMTGDATVPDLTHSPTVTMGATLGGMLLGGRLHEPRAGPGFASRPPRRHLVLRGRALRDAHRQAGFPGQIALRHAGVGAEGRAGLACATHPDASDSSQTAAALPEKGPQTETASHRRCAHRGRRSLGRCASRCVPR